MLKFIYDRVNQMSDEDIVNFSEQKFMEVAESLEELSAGEVTGLIIKGPPGIGKSWFCEEYLKQLGVTHADLLLSDYEIDEDTKEWNCTRLQTGHGPLVRKSDSRNWSIFADLYANSNKGNVVMLDDNDDIMKDVTGLSMLMAATEHKNTKSVDFTRANFNNELRKYGVPAKFHFNGSVLILTNFDMLGEVTKWNDGTYSNRKKSKPSYITRWEALLDRCDYIDMELDHPRIVRVYLENLIRTKNMYTDGNGFNTSRPLSAEELEVMFSWIRKNQHNLKLPLTFRTTNELAKLISRYENWTDRAYRKLLTHI
jgi:hypothetical protein